MYNNLEMNGLSNFIMGIVNGTEWIIIVIIGVILIFGVKKIPELARSLGKASSEYEKAKIESKKELQDIKNQGTNGIGREKLETIAYTLGIDYTNKNDEELRTAIEAEINKSKNNI